AAPAHARGRRALLPVRWPDTYQRSKSRSHYRSRAGIRRKGTTPADLLGQSQLASTAAGYGSPDGWRWRKPRAGLRDLGVQLVLGVQAISRKPRTGARAECFTD